MLAFLTLEPCRSNRLSMVAARPSAVNGESGICWKPCLCMKDAMRGNSGRTASRDDPVKPCQQRISLDALGISHVSNIPMNGRPMGVPELSREQQRHRAALDPQRRTPLTGWCWG